MDKKTFIERFLYDLFNGAEPTGLYTLMDYQRVYYHVDDMFYLIPTKGTFDGHKWVLRTGCSKAVFVFDDFNEVIKIGFTGELEANLKDEPIPVEIEEANEDNFDKIWANSLDFSVNYLMEEIDFFNEAYFQTQKFLLENKFICRIGDIEVATQEKIYSTYRRKHALHKEDSDWKNFSENKPDIANYVVECCTKIGLPKMFLAEMCNSSEGFLTDEVIDDLEQLYDLHSENIGYVLRNSELFPIILDYAGFDY